MALWNAINANGHYWITMSIYFWQEKTTKFPTEKTNAILFQQLVYFPMQLHFPDILVAAARLVTRLSILILRSTQFHWTLDVVPPETCTQIKSIAFPDPPLTRLTIFPCEYWILLSSKWVRTTCQRKSQFEATWRNFFEVACSPFSGYVLPDQIPPEREKKRKSSKLQV